VTVTDFSGTVLYANPYCEVLYGLGPDELVGENAQELALQPVRPELLSEIAKDIFAGKNWEGEFRVTARTAPPSRCGRSTRRCSTTRGGSRV